MRLALILATLLTLGGPACAARQEADPADAYLCEAAAARAAAAENVPVDLLRAISLAETGGGLGGRGRPWPWTTNVEGVGAWHPTREAALAHIRRRHAEGARSYDVGCFQINRRWHGDAFDSLEEMFDPDANARYAAQFLTTLKTDAGDWARAAGWYHSRTPELADRYRRRVETILASLPDAVPDLAPHAPVARPAPQIAPLLRTPGSVGLALATLAPPEGESAPPDTRRILLRRARPLLTMAAATSGQTSTGGLFPLATSGGGSLLTSARPLFD